MEPTDTFAELDVAVAGDRVDARLRRATADALATAAGRPCVVMAHGIAATQDSGLDGFYAAFTAAGLDVVSFDYRHFAGSGGEPRQLVDPARQVADYRAVVAAARRTDGIDPDRVVVWGVSLSGGHVFDVAAQEPQLAAVVSLTPATDGRAVALAMARTQGPRYLARMTAAAVRDARAARRGGPAVTVPVVGAPGSIAALTAPGAEEGMRRVAGPTWRNEFAARLFLTVAAWRPVQAASQVRCPVLVQVADLDQSAPPRAAEVAAQRAGASVHHYPCDHFDVYTGEAWHDRVRDDQVAFLRRVLSPPAPVEDGAPAPARPGKRARKQARAAAAAARAEGA